MSRSDGATGRRSRVDDHAGHEGRACLGASRRQWSGVGLLRDQANSFNLYPGRRVQLDLAKWLRTSPSVSVAANLNPNPDSWDLTLRCMNTLLEVCSEGAFDMVSSKR